MSELKPQAPPTTFVPPPSDPVRPRASILMVDDQPARLLTYEAMLSGLGVECVRALSGLEALDKLLKQEFAVILLDVHMPDMDGFEVARAVREHPRLERTPIIFVTGVHVTELDQLKGYEVGAIDYISVPVVAEILRSKVALLVELHQRRAELKSLNEALRDTREQLEAEHARMLAEKDAQLQAFEHHPDQITVVMRPHHNAAGEIDDWVYLNVNGKALDLLERERDAVIGRKVSDLFGVGAHQPIEHCTRVHTTGEPLRYEARVGNKDIAITIFPAGKDMVVSSGIDVTDRKLAEQALRESREQLVKDIAEKEAAEQKLRDNDRRKDEFLAMLAHELRNPIAPIRNAAEVLSRLVGDSQSRTLVGMIQRQGAHLSRILDDLLDVARITQGRIELRREVVSLTSCIEHALEIVQPQVSANQLHVSFTRTAQPLYVHADRVRLEQCIGNVLSNAVKYTDAGGEVRVALFIEDANAVVEVQDSGIGIAAKFLPHVFDLFAQGERALDRPEGGLGVGLSVCKQLIEMHGGSVAGTSDGIGCGATFRLRLPLQEKPFELKMPDAPGVESSRRVLIVDDNRDAADSLAMCLQLDGHAAKAVYSAEGALEQLDMFAPEVVLLDIGLPRMNGYQVAQRIRAAGSSIKMIALTGYGQEEDKERTHAAGFNAHFTKPVDISALRCAIEDR
jgi:signal transduction histidine kinase/DNA-binding response OmpR family regulator